MASQRQRRWCARVDTVQPSTYLEAIRSDGAKLAGAAATGLDVSVPSLPGWDLAKLALHMGIVHGWAGESVRRRSPEPVDRGALPRAPDGPARIDWLCSTTAALLDALGAAADDDPAGTWGNRQAVTAGFWRRRMAHETSVHRWDAQAAVGEPDPVDTALAADGLAEALELFLPLFEPSGSAPGTLHLHCTDTAGEWLLARSDGRLVVTTGHAKADAAMRGTASDLLLTCWGRRRETAPEVLGDRAVADAWLAEMGW
jgi:uncharacterized protein (TIGR03083 family)